VINSLIDSTSLKLNRSYDRLIENDEAITARKIKKVFLRHDVSKKNLLDAFRLHNQVMQSRVGIDFSKSTVTRYETTFNHIIEFLRHQYNVSDTLLNSIEFSFITNLEHFLKVVRKCNHNSRKSISEISEK
jgi:Phage integrase SAM-like domain